MPLMPARFPMLIFFMEKKAWVKKAWPYPSQKTLQCEEKGTNPCNKCKSCIQADSGNHPDILWINNEKNSIGVDEIRTGINADV
jgi:DNA polymerase III, gamma/tau subunits